MHLIKSLVIAAIATGSVSCGGEATASKTEKENVKVEAPVQEKVKKPVVINKETGLYAIFHTSKGDIKVGLQFELAPMTVGNFVALAKGEMPNTAKADGVPFYDGLKFHRVIPNFMVQGGDPMGNGQGNPGYKFPDEIVEGLVHDGPGVLSMANSGPATNGSQFFITHKETPWLNGKHTVFGHVVSGQDVVNQIAQDDVMNSVEIVAETPAAKAFNGKKAFDTNKVLAVEKAKRAQEAAMKKAEQALEAGKKEMADYIKKNHPNAKQTATGLFYDITTKGSGKEAEKGQLVKVNYTGKLLSGKVFDTSVQAVAEVNGMAQQNRQYQPIEFPLGQRRVIAGWDEGIDLLKEGDKATLIIPSNLAYGARGAGGVIPPNAPLVFDVELVQVKPMPVPQQRTK
ncbi:MAG: peptidylprolyl isomerase [Flavobacteriales bacterium]